MSDLQQTDTDLEHESVLSQTTNDNEIHAESVDAVVAADDAAQVSDDSSPDVVPSDSADGGVDEGDIAADYIEELLDICDLDGDIDISAANGRAYVAVQASDPDSLRLLSKPDTVTALQELTRLAVQAKSGEFSRLILDVGGSREARQAELAALVGRAITRLDEGAARAALPPMSSYERKLIHDIVAERGYTSISEGEGRDRYTVITAAS